jgi:hypothetical protein
MRTSAIGADRKGVNAPEDRAATLRDLALRALVTVTVKSSLL